MRFGLSRVVCVAGLMAALAACSGDDPSPAPADVLVGVPTGEELAATWPVQMSDDATRAPFEANRGWVRLVSQRDLKTATGMLARDGGMGLARVHADAAAMYRQAALLMANALVETYGKTGVKTDPAGTAHLLAVSYAMQGDLDAARAAAKRVDLADPALAPWHAPWKAWLAEDGATWPPDLSALPVGLPELLPGAWPELKGLPHYTLPERDGSTYEVSYADPGAVLALAMWHEAAALQVAGDALAPAVLVYGGRYRLPVESAPAAADLPPELLFGSDFLVPGDASFVSAVVNEGSSAIDAHLSTSMLARITAAVRTSGKVDHEAAIDVAADTRAALLEAMAARSGGDAVYHRPFADVAQVAVLRTLALVAEAEGDREVSGVLRINAWEKSTDSAGSPEYFLSLAAWDASNRYPARGTEIVHNLIRRYPSLEAARYGLDALALRVSREQAGQGAGM